MLQIVVFVLKTTPIIPKLTSCVKFQVWLRKNKYTITKTALEEAWEDSAWRTLDMMNNINTDTKTKVAGMNNIDLINFMLNDIKVAIVFGFFGLLWILILKKLIHTLHSDNK